MSGLVRTYSPWSRVQSRCSRGLSPSWVVTRTSSPSASSPAELVLGQRLRGREVEHAGAALPAGAAGSSDRGEGGQLVGERLPGRRAGGEHDVVAGVGGVGGGRPGAATGARPHARRTPSGARRAPTRPVGHDRPPGRGSTSRWVSRSSLPGTPVRRSTRPSTASRRRQSRAVHGLSLANCRDTSGGGTESVTVRCTEKKTCQVDAYGMSSWFDISRLVHLVG